MKPRGVPNHIDLYLYSMYTNKAQRREVKEAGCCSIKCTARIMIFFAWLTIICGGLYIALALYLFIAKGNLIPLVRNQSYVHCIYLIAFCGCFILLSGCFACSATRNRCVLLFYIVILTSTIVLECLMVFLSLDYTSKMDAELEESFVNDVLNERRYFINIERSIDFIQVEGKCCGAVSFTDYPKPAATESDEEYNFRTLFMAVPYLPDSCCKSYSSGCARSDHPSNIYYNGCLNFFKQQIKQNVHFVTVAAVAFLIIQSFTLIACITLCIKKRDVEDEYQFKETDEDMTLFD